MLHQKSLFTVVNLTQALVNRSFEYTTSLLGGSNYILVQNVIKGGSDIFTRIKQSRGKTKTVSSQMDDHVCSQNIANMFADVCGDLYSRDSLGPEFEALNEQINSKHFT